MKKVAVQVPIKGTPSERVPGKNFRMLGDKPLYRWMLDSLAQLNCWPIEVDVFVDSEDHAVLERVRADCTQVKTHRRDPWFAGPHANGNHLLYQFALRHDYDLYAQAFVTAPFLSARSMAGAILEAERWGTAFTAVKATGFYWHGGKPINYSFSPGGLPRTQDAPLLKETTGFYAIERGMLLATGCRTSPAAIPVLVGDEEALDIDTEQDFVQAELILQMRKQTA